MELLLNNLPLLIAGFCLLAFVVTWSIQFLRMPNEQQIANILEWLKIAVINAEKEFGSGTGQLKLRTVYEAALIRFPWVAKYITFEKFSSWVDLALEWMKEEINNNKAIKNYVLNNDQN